MSLILLSSLAIGAETTCQELLDIHAVGVPGPAIVESVDGNYLSDEERACVAESDLPTEVKTWAMAAPTPPTETLQVEEVEPEVQTEETAEQRAARELREAEAQRNRARAQREWAAHCQSLPNPGVAAILSLLLGYGSGHFYAEQPERGWRFVAAHAAANAVLIGGVAVVYSGAIDLDPDTMAAGNLFVLSAATATLVIHAADAATAPQSARETGEGCY